MSEHTPESLAELEAKKEAHASAFFAMESPICDLVEMAKIVDRAVYEAVGELKVDENDMTIEHVDGEKVTSAMFAVGQVSKMLEDLRATYYSKFTSKQKS